MTKGKRQLKQPDFFIPTADMPVSLGHRFYGKLNKLLAEADFDAFVQRLCLPYHVKQVGRPCIPNPKSGARTTSRSNMDGQARGASKGVPSQSTTCARPARQTLGTDAEPKSREELRPRVRNRGGRRILFSGVEKTAKLGA